MTTAREVLFYFPSPPSPDAVEWHGDSIGRSDLITRTRSRTRVHDKTIDATPGRREHLLNAAIAHIVRRAGREPIALHDVVIHGVRVRAITNSPHLMHFWRQNWYSPEEWQEVTGDPPPAEPRIVVYALGGVAEEAEAAYYSRQTNTFIFFNTSYYGQLKSWVLGAVGRVLAAEQGIHSIHGACVEYDGSGVLYIAPTGTGKSTSSYGLMSYPATRFHSDDWVYVRYAWTTRSGQRVVPYEITIDGRVVARGYQCGRWLSEHPGAIGVARCRDLANHEAVISLSELDWDRPVEAYAYTSEKVFYLRTNLVESFPLVADAILGSDLENVPSPTPEFLTANRAILDTIIQELRETDRPGIRQRLGALPEERLRWLVAALVAFDNARAMLDIAQVFDPARVFTNPMEPVHLTTVFLLKRNPADPTVLQALSLDDFMGRLLVGLTPDNRREIAYNAYRAVDDEAERRAVEVLEERAARNGTTLYTEFERASEIPESLREEFELFRQLYRATFCYDLNTILQVDPRISTKKEAVRLTLQLILYGIKNRSRDLQLTLATYRDHIAG